MGERHVWMVGGTVIDRSLSPSLSSMDCSGIGIELGEAMTVALDTGSQVTFRTPGMFPEGYRSGDAPIEGRRVTVTLEMEEDDGCGR